MLRSFVLLAGAAVAALAVSVAGASGGADRVAASSFPVTVVAPERQGHGHEAAAPHRLAVADGDRDAVRDRRRLAGRRRRRPVRLSRRARRRRRSRASRRTSRRSPPTGPTSSSSPTTRRGSRARSSGSASPSSTRTARRASRARTSRSASSGSSPAATPAAKRVVSGMKAKIATIVDATRARPAAASPSTTSSTPDLYSATSKTFVGQVYTALGLRNIADAADSAGYGLPAALGRVRRLGEPGPDRARRHRVLRAEGRRRSRRGPAGIGSAPCARARSSASTTRSRRAGGRAS